MDSNLKLVLQLTEEMRSAAMRDAWDQLPDLQQQRNIFLAAASTEPVSESGKQQKREVLKQLLRMDRELVGVMKKKHISSTGEVRQARRGGRMNRAYLAA